MAGIFGHIRFKRYDSLESQNRPAASNAKENHQRKYPKLRVPLSAPKRTYQCELTRNAPAATHAHALLTDRDPRHRINGEPTMNRSVIAALATERTE